MLRRARLGVGETVLIVGIGGGVSTAALGLALRLGATVYATSRDEAKRPPGRVPRGRGCVRLGGGLAGGGRRGGRERGPCHLGPLGQGAAPGRTPGGVRATSGPKVELNLPRLFFKQIEVIGSTMGSYPEFDQVTRLVGLGLPVQADEVFARAEYPQALERLARGEQLGKVVLRHGEGASYSPGDRSGARSWADGADDGASATSATSATSPAGGPRAAGPHGPCGWSAVAVVALVAAAVLVAGLGRRRSQRGPDAGAGAGRDARRGHLPHALDGDGQLLLGDSEGGGSDSRPVVTEAEVAGADWRARADSGRLAERGRGRGRRSLLPLGGRRGRLADEPWELLPTEPMSDAGIDDFLFDDVPPRTRRTSSSTLGALYLGDFSEAAGLAGTTLVPLPAGLVEAIGDLTDVEVVSFAGGEVRLRGSGTRPTTSARASRGGARRCVRDSARRPSAQGVAADGGWPARQPRQRDQLRRLGRRHHRGRARGRDRRDPWIDEEAVAEAADGLGPIVWPTVVPDGLVLTDIYAYSGTRRWRAATRST